MGKKIFGAILITLLFPVLLFAFQGKVVKVIDGDTIEVLKSDKQIVKVRLYGVDCPEKKQPFGKKAKKFVSKQVGNKEVEVKEVTTDRYGRTVGIIFVNGQNLNQVLVSQGYAWVYRKYCKESFCSDWVNLEKEAREKQIGLWQDKNPIAPWLWRKNEKILKGEYGHKKHKRRK